MIPGLQIEESDPILKLLLFSHEDLYDAYFTALQAWLKTHETEGFFVGGHEPSGGGGVRWIIWNYAVGVLYSV